MDFSENLNFRRWGISISLDTYVLVSITQFIFKEMNWFEIGKKSLILSNCFDKTT